MGKKLGRPVCAVPEGYFSFLWVSRMSAAFSGAMRLIAVRVFIHAVWTFIGSMLQIVFGHLRSFR